MTGQAAQVSFFQKPGTVHLLPEVHQFLRGEKGPPQCGGHLGLLYPVQGLGQQVVALEPVGHLLQHPGPLGPLPSPNFSKYGLLLWAPGHPVAVRGQQAQQHHGQGSVGQLFGPVSHLLFGGLPTQSHEGIAGRLEQGQQVGLGAQDGRGMGCGQCGLHHLPQEEGLACIFACGVCQRPKLAFIRMGTPQQEQGHRKLALLRGLVQGAQQDPKGPVGQGFAVIQNVEGGPQGREPEAGLGTEVNLFLLHPAQYLGREKEGFPPPLLQFSGHFHGRAGLARAAGPVDDPDACAVAALGQA